MPNEAENKPWKDVLADAWSSFFGAWRQANSPDHGTLSLGTRLPAISIAIRNTLEEQERENSALKRTVEDLAHALRKANARLVNIARMAQDAAVAPKEEEDVFQLIYNEA